MILQSLLTHSPVFLFAASALLAAACLVGRLARALAHRER